MLFDFVPQKEFIQAYTILQQIVRRLNCSSSLLVPVVDATMGSGKLHLCFEVWISIAQEYGGAYTYVKLEESTFALQNEKQVSHYQPSLAKVLMSPFSSNADIKEYIFEQRDVSDRTRSDLGANFIALQIDEVVNDPRVTRILMRARPRCKE